MYTALIYISFKDACIIYIETIVMACVVQILSFGNNNQITQLFKMKIMHHGRRFIRYSALQVNTRAGTTKLINVPLACPIC